MLPAGTKSKLSIATLVALFALPIFGAGEATASRPHEFSAEFASKCLAEPCTGEAIKRPTGIATSEASGEVYVLDEGEKGGAHGRVAIFSSAGAFVSEFNGSGTLLNGKGEHFEGKAAGSGGKAGEIETSRFQEPQAIALDNACQQHKPAPLTESTTPTCKEYDPSNGDVYVIDSGNLVVDKYSATGEYLGQITEAGGAKFSERALDGVAVDPRGKLFVYREHPFIDAFTNAEPNVFLPPELNPNSPGFARPSFAVDSKDDFYGRVGVHATPQVMKWTPTGEIAEEEVGSGVNSAVSVEQSTDNALIDNLTSVGVFDPAGAEVERLGKEHGEEHLKEGAGIGVDAQSETLFVGEDAAAAAHAVIVFGPAAATVPKVEAESFSKISESEASLEAQVNPRGEEGEAAGLTTYEFQYGICAQPTDCAASGYEHTTPAAQIAASFEPELVSSRLSGLQPSTTYHFRTLVRNGHGAGTPGGEVSFRTQISGGELPLPDGRAYELVSPPDKQGALIEPLAEAGVIQAAASGDAITYLTNAPTEEAPAGFTNEMQVLSRRGSSAWSSKDLGFPHASATGFAVGDGPEYKLFDPELELAAIQPFGEYLPLSEEASESTAYLHSLQEGCGAHCFRPLVTGKPPYANVPAGTQFGEEGLCKTPSEGLSARVVCGPQFLGASPDLSQVVLFSPSVALAAGAVPGELFEWSGGVLAPVSVLPGGAPTAGTLGLGLSQATRNAISSDGSRVVWSNGSALYLRDLALGETVQLDKATCGGCTSGSGAFQIASADDSRIFFTDQNRLSEGAGSSGSDLYECRIVTSPKLGCALSDLTPAPGAGKSAEVQGGVLGAGEEGNQIYFVAKGALSGANAEGKSPVEGQPNLYLHEGGVNVLVATLSEGDEHDWFERLSVQPTRASSNGRYLAFMSQASPTGYDNRDVETAKPVAEVYLYDATSKHLSCASCMPSGERPVGVEYHKLEQGKGGLVGGVNLWEAKGLVAANVAGWTAIGSASDAKSRYQPRYLSDEGRLFFNSADALVPQDGNETQDVYEYEPSGIGSCSAADPTYTPDKGGCVSLISSGTSKQESAFLDASESGDDVFFLTSARLSKLDEDNARDVYDAHLCTGASPCITYTATPAPHCEAEPSEASCRPPASPLPQIFGAPASQTFQPPTIPPAPATTTSAPPKKTAEQLRIEKLNKALKACRTKKSKKLRQSCEQSARKRYAKPGVKKSKAKAKKAKKSSRARRRR